MGSTDNAPTAEELRKPRILCLHGGGVTGEIFFMQARSIRRYLPDFRLVFPEAPFYCDPHPAIIPVYEDFGPFRRWLRWMSEHAEMDDEAAIEEIMYSINTAKKNDPGTGPWVGLMGFSQGAKLAASILYEQQIAIEQEGKADTDYKFAVLLAGRSPLVSLSDRTIGPAMVRPGSVSEGFRFEGISPHILRLPQIHVHGLKDPGLHLHRKLLDQYCDRDAVTLFEWDGDHRVPIKTADVKPITDAIYRIAKEQGVLLNQVDWFEKATSAM